MIKLLSDGAIHGISELAPKLETNPRNIIVPFHMSSSVSQIKNDLSRSLQMIERPLMTADELKALPKETSVATKTGFNPIKVKLKLFFKWGIQFEDKPFVVPL